MFFSYIIAVLLILFSLDRFIYKCFISSAQPILLDADDIFDALGPTRSHGTSVAAMDINRRGKFFHHSRILAKVEFLRECEY